MLNLNPTDMILVLVNLLVLYFLLRHFLFKPVTAMIESRQQEISHNLAAAEDQRIKAEAMLEEYDHKLSLAQHEANDMVLEAKSRADQEYQVILKAARHDAQRLTEETERQLERERKEMIAGVSNEVATLALLAAAKVSGKTMNEFEIGRASCRERVLRLV